MKRHLYNKKDLETARQFDIDTDYDIFVGELKTLMESCGTNDEKLESLALAYKLGYMVGADKL